MNTKKEPNDAQARKKTEKAQYNRRYNAANKQKISDIQAAWYRANAEKKKAQVTAWKKANPEKVAQYRAVRRARIRAALALVAQGQKP